MNAAVIRMPATTVQRQARTYAQLDIDRGDARADFDFAAARYEIALLRERLAQKDADLIEAVSALEARARDAFDCGRFLPQDVLEAQWDAEAPEDYAQYKRLWWGAQL